MERACAPRGDTVAIDAAVAALGRGTADRRRRSQRHVAPLFSRVRAACGDRVYLANHSLGRPLDATDDDVREGLAAWYARMGDAWEAWDAEMQAFRGASAAAGRAARRLRRAQDERRAGPARDAQHVRSAPRVVATRGEFDSLDVILREYARRGRIALTLVEPRADGASTPPTSSRRSARAPTWSSSRR